MTPNEIVERLNQLNSKESWFEDEAYEVEAIFLTYLTYLLKSWREMKADLKLISDQQDNFKETNKFNDLCQVAKNSLASLDRDIEEGKE